jgi:hypothetical protein
MASVGVTYPRGYTHGVYGAPRGELGAMEHAVNIDHVQFPAWEENDVSVRRDQSFLRFVLPVAFPELSGRYRFEQRAERLAASGCWRLLGGEKQGFLPHARIHFNSTKPLGDSAVAPGERPLDPVTAFGYIFTAAEPDALPLPWHGFSFRVPGPAGRHVQVDVTDAQVGIFRLGVGFVSLELRPRSDVLPDWLDTLHFLRFYGGRGEKLSSLTPEAADSVRRIEDFLGPVLDAAILSGERSPFMSADRSAGPRPGRRVRELYTRGEFVTFASLFVDDLPGSQQPRLLYTVLNRFRATSQATPADEDDDQSWLLPYQGDQQFLNSIEGSAFVAFDAGRTQFDLDTLPAHLRTTYFTLFLLALLQRFALDQLSEAVARSTGRVLTESERGHARGELERITGLDARLLDFTGRCYFVQVSQSAHHHAYYAQLREVNQIDGRYREVTAEIHALRAHAGSRVNVEQERSSLRVAAALMVITCILLPIQVIEALFADKLPEMPGIRRLSPGWSAITAGLVLLAALGVALLILYGGRRHRRRVADGADNHLR